MYICVCKKITEVQLKDSFIKTDCNFNESQKKCIEIIEEYKRTNRLNRLLFLADSSISGTKILLNLVEKKILTFGSAHLAFY